MKNYRFSFKYFILIFSLLIQIINITQSFCQNHQQNLEKYWYYRERLYQYFTVPTAEIWHSNITHEEQHGTSLMAQNRNLYSGVDFELDFGLHRTGILEFGDQTINMGWYMGVLATEYKLLNENGEETKETMTELYFAMKAFERLDLSEDHGGSKCCYNDATNSYQYHFWNNNQLNYDGLFVREDADFNFINRNLDYINNGLQSTDYYPNVENGKPVFHAEQGTYFRASINSFYNCDAKSTLTLNLAYDSMISVHPRPDRFIEPDLESTDIDRIIALLKLEDTPAIRDSLNKVIIGENNFFQASSTFASNLPLPSHQTPSMEWKICPNPANENVTIIMQGASNPKFNLVVSDLYGNICYQSMVNSSRYSFNGKAILKPGIYTVTLKNQENLYTKKLIIYE